MPLPPNARAGPSAQKKPRRKPLAVQHKAKHVRRINEDVQIKQLEQAVQNFNPRDDMEAFTDLPMSDNTKRGLKKAFFVKMTDIQAKSIPPSLKGQDVLGSARTGSGKTLAFLIPVLEILLRQKWGPQDGLGALLISPTRELAMQIFEVLRSIGGYHSFSAGLVIGGKNLKDERDRLSRMNILVATPGRLLQHMDQTIGFECDNLQVLVLDEADRILDMGFARSLNAIIGHLPKSRQTLLFSATQTQSVQDLARLSLKDPVYVGVKEKDAAGATPSNLEQHYLVCDLDKKLDVLFSFIKTHLQAKVLVFMSSCKQVRFVFETFCKMHPGISLLHLHGKQKQMKRVDIFQKFIKSKTSILFATDIAARGLDFPSVDWVVQLDAPEDAETYIHRVGRTARYQAKGQSLLFLLPSEEEGMLQRLKEKDVPVEKIKVKESKTMSIQNMLQKFAFQDTEIKYLAQRAFVSYLRSIYLQKDKTVFKMDALPLEKFAAALGLPGAPRVKFVTKEMAKQRKNAMRAIPSMEAMEDPDPEDDQSEDDSDDDQGDDSSDAESIKSDNDTFQAKITAEKTKGVRTKYDRMFERKNQNVLSKHYSNLIDHSDSDGSEDLITLKRADHALSDDEDDLNEPTEGTLPTHHAENISKRKLKVGESKKLMAKYKSKGTKLVFDDEGQAHAIYEMKDDVEFLDKDRAKELGHEFAVQQRGRMVEADVLDKEVAKDKKKEKKRKRKERDRGEMSVEDGPSIIPAPEDDGYETPEFDLPPHSEDQDEDNDARRPTKRARRMSESGVQSRQTMQASLEEDEQLALQFLHRR